jgi:hypothetical protein
VIESWLTEIGENELARVTKRIRATVGDPEMGVNRFLQAVMGPSANINKLVETQKPDTTVIVRPKSLDFGQLYPGLSAPMLMTIAGVKGALVSGIIRSVASWIMLDQTIFDGTSTPVRVRIDSTGFRGSKHYMGTIIVTPDNGEQEITVAVEFEVLGYTVTSRRSSGEQTGLPQGMRLQSDEKEKVGAEKNATNEQFTPSEINGPPKHEKSLTISPTNTLEQANLPTTTTTPMKVFFSYAREDKLLRDELVKHLSNLKRQRMITGWLDRNISAGKEWAQQIDDNLNTSQIILLLVSSDFLASDYCYSIEMIRALERHSNGDARVIPVILRPVDWENAPFSKLQVLPTGARAVTLWDNRDEAFSDIAKGIWKVVNELLASYKSIPH